MIWHYSHKINVMRDFLVPQEQEVLLEAHRAERVKRKADFTPKAVLKVKQMVESGRLKNFIQEEMRNSFAGIEF